MPFRMYINNPLPFRFLSNLMGGVYLSKENCWFGNEEPSFVSTTIKISIFCEFIALRDSSLFLIEFIFKYPMTSLFWFLLRYSFKPNLASILLPISVSLVVTIGLLLSLTISIYPSSQYPKLYKKLLARIRVPSRLR